MSFELEGKVAIVTGAATGIGKAIAFAFGAAGAQCHRRACQALRRGHRGRVRQELPVNVKGTFHGCQLALERMATGGQHLELNDRSNAPRLRLYDATKGAIEAVTHVIAKGVRGVRNHRQRGLAHRTPGCTNRSRHGYREHEFAGLRQGAVAVALERPLGVIEASELADRRP